jgi:hypothetical protein
MSTENDDFVRGLREMADFYEAHPTLKMPVYSSFNVFVTTKEDLAACARLARWEKVYNENWFCLRRTFGNDQIQLDINVDRSTICRKVVIGTRIEPARPERIVEVVEWFCDDAVLSPKNITELKSVESPAAEMVGIQQDQPPDDIPF